MLQALLSISFCLNSYKSGPIPCSIGQLNAQCIQYGNIWKAAKEPFMDCFLGSVRSEVWAKIFWYTQKSKLCIGSKKKYLVDKNIWLNLVIEIICNQRTECIYFPSFQVRKIPSQSEVFNEISLISVNVKLCVEWSAPTLHENRLLWQCFFFGGGGRGSSLWNW